MSRRRITTISVRPLTRAAGVRGGPRRAVARAFDYGEPIRLESNTVLAPAFIEATSPEVIPAARPEPSVVRGASLSAQSSVWSDAVEQLGNSPYPFAVDDYGAHGDGEALESSVRPDSPEVAVAAGLSAEQCSAVDDPDAEPARRSLEAPAAPSATQAAAPAVVEEVSPERSSGAGDWELATDEAFEKTLQDAQQRAAVSPAPEAPAVPSPAQSAPAAAMASGHDVFDRMASAMQHATAFDLGHHEIDDRLDHFEADVLASPKRPARSAAADAAIAAALSLDDTDLVAQLAMMEADEPSTPSVAPVVPGPMDIPAPSSPPATNPPSEAQS